MDGSAIRAGSMIVSVQGPLVQCVGAAVGDVYCVLGLHIRYAAR